MKIDQMPLTRLNSGGEKKYNEWVNQKSQIFCTLYSTSATLNIFISWFLQKVSSFEWLILLANIFATDSFIIVRHFMPIIQPFFYK